MTCFLYPDIGRVDEPLQLHMTGLVPNEKVTITLSYDHRLTGLWTSECVIHADRDGRLQLNNEDGFEKNPLVSLLWQLRSREGNSSPFLPHEIGKPIEFTIDISTNESNKQIKKTVQRLFKEDEVTEEKVSDSHFNGSYYSYNKHKEMPVIIILGVMNGISPKYTAALLASHGYSALAVTFHHEESHNDIPIEAVNKAVQWVKHHKSVKSGKVILFGHSKWAELSLLAAAKFHDIDGVIVSSPPSNVFHGASIKKGSIRWTENGEPLPSVRKKSFLQTFFHLFNKKAPSSVDDYKLLIKQYEKQKRSDADIHVQKIQGPLLLISGGSDAYWPSEEMCQKIVTKLDESNFNYEVRHLNHTHSGHTFIQPYLPAVIFPTNKSGGTVTNNAIAGAESWNEIIVFLEKHFPPVTIEKETVPFYIQPSN